MFLLNVSQLASQTYSARDVVLILFVAFILSLVWRFIFAFFDGWDGAEIKRSKFYLFFYGLGFKFNMSSKIKKMMKEQGSDNDGKNIQ